MEMPHLAYEKGGCATFEPVVGDLFLIEAFQQAEGIVNLGRFPGESITVVLLLKFGMHLLGGTFVFLGQHGDVGCHVGDELLLGDAADGGELGV